DRHEAPFQRRSMPAVGDTLDRVDGWTRTDQQRRTSGPHPDGHGRAIDWCAGACSRWNRDRRTKKAAARQPRTTGKKDGKVAGQTIRIRLKAYDHEAIDASAR